MKVNLNNTDNNDYVRGYKDGKVAGATAEREQFKPVIDALEEIQRRIKRGKAASSYQLEMIRPIINKALEQWKGKEEKPEPTVSNCGMCGKEGINQYLGNQFYLCEECFNNYENSRDQP